MTYIREAAVEGYLVAQVAKKGGRAYKWVSPGNDGVPDRIVLFPHYPAIFVETKAPKGRLRPAQDVQHRVLAKLGTDVRIIYTKDQVDEFIRSIFT